jgi:hypothetical protein
MLGGKLASESGRRFTSVELREREHRHVRLPGPGWLELGAKRRDYLIGNQNGRKPC